MESKQIFTYLDIVRKPAWLLAGVLGIALTLGGTSAGADNQSGTGRGQVATYQEAGESTCTSDSTWETPPVPGRRGEPY